mmetsp:Transcript_49412/g.154740  ORF Transcript_49412/g.154740 Transcript_49412/m.154740 type:complete len:83 (-) Transcript_49412:12-260(-)
MPPRVLCRALLAVSRGVGATAKAAGARARMPPITASASAPATAHGATEGRRLWLSIGMRATGDGAPGWSGQFGRQLKLEPVT